MTYSDAPQPPQPPTIPEDWEHHDLYEQVLEALQVLPSYFKTSTFIEGIQATDIFTLNSALGATIESQVVASLNLMRPVWDPDEKYQLYSFVRQSQTFPDVLFKKTGSTSSSDILFGIELKGWYLLAKEGEPSLRYKVTAAACADADLVCVVPWALSNVLAGSPQIISPYVVSAKYAAEYRNYHWQHIRTSSADKSIRVAEDVAPYPAKSDQISDRPASDGGGNFGRFARTGVMDDYLFFARTTGLCGIPAQNWLQFFSIFTDQKDPTEIKGEIDALRARYGAQGSLDSPISVILDQLELLIESD